MSEGDDEPEDTDQVDEEETATDEPSAADESEGSSTQDTDEEAVDYELDVETFEQRLDDVATAIDDAETESDLDEVATTLDAIESDLERADLPEPDDEDEAPPAETLQDRLSGLRDDLEDARGPYAEDVVAELESVQETIRETRWTDTGTAEVADGIESFVATVNEELDADLDVPDGDPEALADGVDPIAETIGDMDLDPDDDASVLESLMDAAETLSSAVTDAEEWDDLSVREQLQAQGFYDSLKGKHKDFPPEWTAVQEWENEGNAEMILLALDTFDSDFMERHCLESLERMGDPDALEAMVGRAERRNRPAIRVLGKIGVAQDDVVDTLLEFVGTESDPALQKVTMKALGEMGAADAAQAIADQLAAENASVRSRAARALGLIGDPRAVDPLVTVLADDDEDTVRASAAWALVQIGTEPALSAAADHADDHAYVVAAEAEPAAAALGEEPDATTA